MKKVRIGVMGVYRGSSMINYCRAAENAEVVAVCDKWVEGLERKKKEFDEENVKVYTDFDEFIKHDMDAVVLANYANEHAPFAIKAMKAGKHVYSEVLPVQTMKEAVALIETVEQTGMIYAYGENYCFMPAPYEIRRLYREGKLGEFEYAEGEYIHNCESIWPAIAYGDPDHWRNNMYATFYCTHSLGPIVHITGLRPVSVTGFEGGMIARHMRTGAKGGSFGIEMVTFENGGICKSIHGGLYKNSIWYTFYGSKGRAETAREDPEQGDVSHIYVNADEYDGEYPRNKHAENYYPNHEDVVKHPFGHGGSDYYVMWNFVEKIKGNPDADTIDVYEALDMSLPGMFAYRSVLNGGVPTEIPNLRDKAVRDRYRNDTMCSDPKAAGEMLIPAFSKGNPEFDPGVYEHQKQLWLDELAGKDGTGRVNGYLGLAMNNGAAAKKQKQE